MMDEDFVAAIRLNTPAFFHAVEFFKPKLGVVLNIFWSSN